MRIGPSTRWLTIPIVLLLVGGQAVNVGGQTRQLIVATYGGTFLDAQQKAYFDPFTRETGIRVVVAGEPSLAKLKAMVDAGNTEWDLALYTLQEMYVLQQQKLLAQIDYSGFSKAELDQYLAGFVTPYGVGAELFATAIVYNTKAFQGGNHPRSWADVWDIKRFPGPRMLFAMDVGGRLLEIPLLADGVSPKNLYPLDIDRAFRALDTIRPSVVRWGKAAGDISLLASGDAVVGNASTGRALAMRDQGAPIDFEWNQALVSGDVWVIPKGARNYQNALRFLQFFSIARNQALFAAIYPLAPVNRGAYRYLSAANAARLPGTPTNALEIIVRNDKWWAQVDASGKSNIQKVSDRWLRWIEK